MFTNALRCGVAFAALSAASTEAATINLVDLGGVTGSQAEQGFKIAANYWGSMFTNDVVINLGVRFAPLAPNIIGSTGSRRVDYSVANWQSRINATKSGSQLDQSIVLPGLNSSGGASFITNGVAADGNDDTSTLQYINGDSTSSQTLYMNSSLVKAIGGTLASPDTLDGSVTFSSNFGFDFDPSNSVKPDTFDFIGVAIHEIGHALGFVSGVDFLDYYGYPDGPGAGALGYSLNDTSIFSALDMFRYSSDAFNVAPGDGPSLDLSAGGTPTYFSIDGGATALFGNTMSTGAYNGDGRQASHWKDTPGCQVGNGIMDPTFCYKQTGVITALDLAAFDAMGWNLNVDALANNGSYRVSSSQILRDYLGIVPEPATWGMMILGFGMVGAVMRQRATTVRFSPA